MRGPARLFMVWTVALVAVTMLGGCQLLSRGDLSSQPPSTGSAPTASSSPAPAGAPTATTAPAAAAPTPRAGSPSGAQRPNAGAANSVAAQVYQREGPSVVNITSLALVSPMPGASAQEQRGIGSGFILDRDGRIVTNNHVVQDATQLNVTFSNRATVPAKLVGRDPDNDLAVVQVDPNGTYENARSVGELLRPAALGDSDQVVIGENAVAIGSPLGLQQTVTAGIVSAVREPGEDVGAGVGAGNLDLIGGAIQTDASINPGNSGGPLFNAAGEVIGVNTAILSQSGGNIGIGFAIPINVVKRVAPVLIQSGRYPHPFIGVTTVALSRMGAALKRDLGLPENQTGLLVQEVSAGAQQAGIRPGQRAVNVEGGQIRVGGDIIVAIDRQEVTGGELRAYIENNKKPGDSVTLTVLRDGQRIDVPVALTERPQTQNQPQPRSGRPSP